MAQDEIVVRNWQRQRFQPQETSFAGIYPVFRSSFIENNRHSIVGGFDQQIRSLVVMMMKVLCH